MLMAHKFAFRPVQRIRRRREYEQVYRSRRRYNTKQFVIHYRANDYGFDRLGLSVSRKLGKAVQRNKIKRAIRELFRTNPDQSSPWVDLVVVPNASFQDAEYRDLQRNWRDAVERIKARMRS